MTSPSGSISGIVELLDLLTRRFPPLSGHAHQLILQKGKLQLNLVNTAPCWKFTFSEDDLKKQPVQLFAEIIRLMSIKDPLPPAA